MLEVKGNKCWKTSEAFDCYMLHALLFIFL